jgi:hypothetical protein
MGPLTEKETSSVTIAHQPRTGHRPSPQHTSVGPIEDAVFGWRPEAFGFVMGRPFENS